MAVVFAPALSPAALAYDARASGPDASARLILPGWDSLDGGIDPFDKSLIPRRAMEHPQEWDDVIVAVGTAACSLWFTGIGGFWCATTAVGYAVWKGVGNWPYRPGDPLGPEEEGAGG